MVKIPAGQTRPSKYSVILQTGKAYPNANSEQNYFVITSVGPIRDRRVVNTAIIVQLDNGTIIIDRDIFDKPLVDALIQAGVPRSQIILTYVGNLCRSQYRWLLSKSRE